MKPLITIIIPHYNSCDTLKKLIQSIPCCKDFQIIVVDDRSTEGVSELDRFILRQQKSNPNLLFLKNEQGKKGAGTCRNLGLEAAEGKWLLFADADDFFTEAFETVVRRHTDSEEDIVWFVPTSLDLRTGQLGTRHLLGERTIRSYYEEPDNEYRELQLRFKSNVPWSKLIRRSMVERHRIRFDEVMVSNDEMFSAKCGLYSEKIKASLETIYCVTRSAGSLVSNIGEETFDIRLEVFIRKYHFLKDNLSRRQFRILDISGQEKIFTAVQNHYPAKKIWQVIRTLQKNKVAIINLQALNPLNIYRKIRLAQLLSKNRKRDCAYFEK